MVLTVQGLFLVEAHAGQVVDFTRALRIRAKPIA
jgi:hypothetical protein